MVVYSPGVGANNTVNTVLAAAKHATRGRLHTRYAYGFSDSRHRPTVDTAYWFIGFSGLFCQLAKQRSLY